MTSTIPAPTSITPGLNKFEKIKAEKDGLALKSELERIASLGWENMDEGDRDYRLKWLGLFFRPVTPGKFMMRLRMPAGMLTSHKLRVLAGIVQQYGDDGHADITTRQNLQLRGIKIEDTPNIFVRLAEAGMTSVQSGMDNVRNITASPIAGLDAGELIDVRPLVQQVQDMITRCGEGNPEFSNLPRKFNIAIEGGRDNAIHAEINDIAFVPAFREGILGFNVLVGGFFSAKRCEAAIPLDAWVSPDGVVALCRAILEVYRDHGLRANRQKSRLMWLIDAWGLERFRQAVAEKLSFPLLSAAPRDEMDWQRRDHIGIYPQKQLGFYYAGLHIPVGRLKATDMVELAHLADIYGRGEMRLTVEQNLIIPHIPDFRLEAFRQEPLLQKFSVNPPTLARSLVSCTGAQFCNFALIETKNRALAMVKELEAELILTRSVRMHWTGCPNSCGQPQVADIGLMGTKTRRNGQTLDAVDIYMGGKVGPDAHLGTCVMEAIPCNELKPVLRHLLIEHFQAQPRDGVLPQPLEPTTVATTPLPVPVVAETKEKGETAAMVAGVALPSGAVPIAFNQSAKEVGWDGRASILEIAEQSGVELSSSCRAGSCGTCKQKLLSGEVSYTGDPEGLDDQERAAGYILTCIAQPVGRVVIDA